MAPMRWPTAVAGSAESGAADLADLCCDSTVHGVFVQIIATYCSACADRMREIAGLRETWIRNGVQWIFMVSDASSSSQASAYVDRYGIDFGYRTNDADNSAGSMTITGSSIYSSIPWTAVIRTSDMLLYRTESYSYLDLEAIAAELGRSGS